MYTLTSAGVVASQAGSIAKLCFSDANAFVYSDTDFQNSSFVSALRGSRGELFSASGALIALYNPSDQAKEILLTFLQASFTFHAHSAVLDHFGMVGHGVSSSESPLPSHPPPPIFFFFLKEGGSEKVSLKGC